MKKQQDIAIQTKCIYCKKEHYTPAVYLISFGECACVWCGKIPPKLTLPEYNALMKEDFSKSTFSLNGDAAQMFNNAQE